MSHDSRHSFLVRAPRAVFVKLRQEAKALGLSTNQLCLRKLASGSANVARPGEFPPLLRGNVAAEVMSFVQSQVVPAFGADLIGVVLFGSAARGALRASSDIDLLIVLKKTANLDRDTYRLLPSKKLLGHLVEPLILQLPDVGEALRSVWLEIAIDGVILFDVDFSTAQTLARGRASIAEQKVERCFAHGVPYWVHKKPDKESQVQAAA